mmetsp:Transcript_16916/g.30313  ORF Transcript_16916/g.30313 Transcript_16916/m.30313 type:complete len:325 (+) Transcript_16916:177-1151(+)|eukprot:CAMPEP_0197515956 /NCGR_PEP_ID=MMETSP1318-20131121/903_1 /TAXON_ID=552666 /ORGANISM="Partenskyella glossopodia, Strain RCC365" /LENGTH=324 /DNA_ID=CAMNT_0043064441 /DNA_START=119 /DNA_END=1093 /DNA_ORIENTATION=-
MSADAKEKGAEEVVLYENLIDIDLRNGIQKDDPELDHRCQLFNSPSLLFDKKWMGSDNVRIELVTSTERHAKAAANAFSKQFELAGLQGVLTTENTALKPHRNSPEGCSAVLVNSVKISPPVKPDPLLALIGVTLWIEPNKLEKLEEKDRWERIEGGDNATLAADNIREQILAEIKRLEADQKTVLQALKRLQNFSQLPARQTKAADVFRYMQAKKQQLKALAAHSSGVTRLYRCKICGCLMQALGTIPEEKALLDKLKPPASKLSWDERLKAKKEKKQQPGATASGTKTTSSSDDNKRDATKEQIRAKIEELEAKVGKGKDKS